MTPVLSFHDFVLTQASESYLYIVRRLEMAVVQFNRVRERLLKSLCKRIGGNVDDRHK